MAWLRLERKAIDPRAGRMWLSKPVKQGSVGIPEKSRELGGKVVQI
jgi:hypothetical protein